MQEGYNENEQIQNADVNNHKVLSPSHQSHKSRSSSSVKQQLRNLQNKNQIKNNRRSGNLQFIFRKSQKEIGL